MFSSSWTGPENIGAVGLPSASFQCGIMGCMFTFMFYCVLGKESIVKFLSLFYLIFASVLAHFFSITTYHTYQNKRDNMPNRTSDLEQDASASDAETDPTARVTQTRRTKRSFRPELVIDP